MVTLAPFPKTDLAQKVAEAVALAPGVETVLQVDLTRYLAPPLAWIVPLIRPKLKVAHRARVLDFAKAVAARARRGARLRGDDGRPGLRLLPHRRHHRLPKVAQHRARGILYNGWCGQFYMFTERDVMMCPLPMFHVFAAYPILMSCLVSGAQVVMPTPQGYRGEGVMDNFWKLIERHKVTFLITVPTAVAALMQRKVDADVSTLQLALSGSAAMPVELFHRFEEATGVKVMEGYGLTEATCLVAVNPPYGERKVGSVGLPFAYTDVAILHCDPSGAVTKECGTDEVGEICVRNPGVNAEVYTDGARNRGVIAEGGYLRTGDLGRIDADGYLWITGRAKDLIIRGGHNIDPAHHRGRADAASGGGLRRRDRPARRAFGRAAGRLCRAGRGRQRRRRRRCSSTCAPPSPSRRRCRSTSRSSPSCRRRRSARSSSPTCAGGRSPGSSTPRWREAGSGARVAAVVEDKRLGLVAELAPGPDGRDATVEQVLGQFTVPWRWREGPG